MMKHSPLESQPLLMITICLMAGIAVADCLCLPMAYLLLALVVSVVLVLLVKNPYAQSLAIAASVVVLGILLSFYYSVQQEVEWPAGEVCYEAIVLSNPVEKPKTVSVDILLVGGNRKLKCYLYKDARSCQLQIGDALHIQSVIKPNSDWRSGTFDYRRYMEVHGFSGTTFVAGWKWHKIRVSLKGLSKLQRTKLVFLRLRSQLLKRLSAQQVGDSHYAIVAAMALGDKSALSRDMKEVYSVTGASHVLALSGLHLGIIYMLLSWLVVGRRWRMVAQILVIVGIWAFVFLVGLPVSAVRSAVMISVYALLSLGNRDRLSLNVLAFTAMVMLLVNPLSLYDVGFQMSFAAVASILLFGSLFGRFLSPAYLMEHRVLSWCWGMIRVSCAAQIGVAPLIAYYFGRFSTLFLLTNFIVVPLTTLILYLTPVVLAIPSLAHLLFYIVSGLNAALSFISRIPWASIEGLHPSLLQTVMVYVIIIACYLLIGKVVPARGWSPSRRGS